MIYKIVQDEKVHYNDINSETVPVDILIKEDDIDFIQAHFESEYSGTPSTEYSHIIHLKREVKIHTTGYKTDKLKLKSLTDMEVFPS